VAWFDHGESRIYYEDAGSGVPVLVLPGWGLSIDDMAPVRQALAPSYRVIAADAPGAGKSGPQPRQYAPGYIQEDAGAFLALLAAVNAMPAHVVGFSDGGEYALVMAAEQPHAVRSVVTWGAVGQLPDMPGMADAMSNMVDDPIPPMAGFSEYLKATYGEANARLMCRSFGQTLREMMAAGGDISRSRAADIMCPALLLTGEHDMLAPPDMVADMAADMPNASFQQVAGAHHSVHHEQPDWLCETLLAWLADK
jgi:valacyclovir hydrolase